MLYLLLLEQISSTSSLFPQKSFLIRPCRIFLFLIHAMGANKSEKGASSVQGGLDTLGKLSYLFTLLPGTFLETKSLYSHFSSVDDNNGWLVEIIEAGRRYEQAG